MELWLDCFDAFCFSSQILTETLKNYHVHSPYENQPIYNGSDDIPHRESPYKGVAMELDRCVTDIHCNLRPAITGLFKERCLRPVEYMLSLAPDIIEKVQQRKLSLLDFDAHKSKMEKEHAAGRDNSHPSVSKKIQKFNESAIKLETLQKSIEKSMKEFQIARPVTLGPELASFTACMYCFSSTMSNSVVGVLPEIPQAISSMAMIDNRFAEEKIRFEKERGSIHYDLHHHRLSTLSEKVISTKVIDPITIRSSAMGGSYGGYGEVPSSSLMTKGVGLESDASIKTSGSDTESNRLSTEKHHKPVYRIKSGNLEDIVECVEEEDGNSKKADQMFGDLRIEEEESVSLNSSYISSTSPRNVSPNNRTIGSKRLSRPLPVAPTSRPPSTSEGLSKPVPPPKPPRSFSAQRPAKESDEARKSVPQSEASSQS